MQVSLQDELWQLFVDPTRFDFLNFRTKELNTPIARGLDRPGGLNFINIVITLDQEIYLASRKVKDLKSLFGEIVGFKYFFITLLGLLVGSIPRKLYSYSTASDLFRANQKTDK